MSLISKGNRDVVDMQMLPGFGRYASVTQLSLLKMIVESDSD